MYKLNDVVILQMGFCLGTTVDGGETMATRAAWFSPGYAGQGIYKMLTNQVQ